MKHPRSLLFLLSTVHQVKVGGPVSLSVEQTVLSFPSNIKALFDLGATINNQLCRCLEYTRVVRQLNI